MTSKKSIGKQGEDYAYQYLLHNGFDILATNWTKNRGELDLVCKKSETLVVVEVKTRTTSDYGEPHEGITGAQQEKLIETAEAYMEEHNLDLELRFDIISIVLRPQLELEHIQDAF